MKVNMTPNPLDVVTIHASQGDTEARQWEFELHNNGELIDTSGVTDQMVFKAYKGGTEQILPENGSTPTTSPFKGDIKYPQGLLSDQEFLYRESPTEEDGLAKITDIKGNTLVWNQLVPSLSTMSAQNGTISVADNVATITSSSSASYLGISKTGSSIALPKGGHKYLLTAEVNSPKALSSCNLWYGNQISYIRRDIPANTWTKVSAMASYGTPTGQYVQLRGYGSFEQGDTLQVKNWNIFDLTAMGHDSITTIEEFTSLFSLPYYAYNQGTLLSFMGSGIKTVGKNLLMPSTVTSSDVSYVDGYYNINATIDSATERRLFGNWGIQNAVSLGLTSGTYIWTTERLGINIPAVSVRISVHGTESYETWSVNTPRYINADDKFFILLYFSSAGTYNGKVGIQLEFGSTATDFEPYTESTLSLPISTYFPSGMKDVPDYTNGGKIYDEMTSNKADTRVGSVDLGTLNWTTYSSPERHVFRAHILSNMKQPNDANLPNAMCSRYEPMAYNPISANDDGYFAIGAQRIVIIEHDYTDPVAFKESLSNVYLYYELATPTETSFTTASLVTENAEIPLSNNDGTLIGKCTEQLSENPGFIDAKIKLTDADGECYSNKLQLHVERSPQ